MARRSLVGILVSVSVAAGCGGSPSSPSPGAGTSNLAAEFAVMSAMSQAMSQVALGARPGGDLSNGFTMPCPNGGSMVFTFSPPDLQQGTSYRSSSRIEHRDCRNQGVTLNGDPYMDMSSEHAFPTGVVGDSTSTIRMTGGMRLESGGVQGRVRFNCTMNLTVRVVNGSPQVSSTATGTITMEQPLGSTPVVRPCGG